MMKAHEVITAIRARLNTHSSNAKKRKLAKMIRATMRELKKSKEFSSSDWKLFYSLACRLQPELVDEEPFKPKPLIQFIGFKDVGSFVVAPVVNGGVGMEPGDWRAMLTAAKSMKEYPGLSANGYSMRSLSNIYNWYDAEKGQEIESCNGKSEKHKE